jgi:hypothetical protein
MIHRLALLILLHVRRDGALWTNAIALKGIKCRFLSSTATTPS